MSELKTSTKLQLSAREATELSLEHISYTYHTLHGETCALQDISFTLMPGEFAAVVGPSGCGKSTLLNILSGLLKPDSGVISCYQDSRAPSIGYMLQKDHLLEWRTIYKNITLGLEIQKKSTPEALIAINNMLVNYGLWDFRNSYPRQLSGGMRQRAALIRTLALSPDILLLDEPFSALDYQTRLNVSNDIGNIIKEQKITTLLVTHDLSEAISMADTVYVLSKRPGTIRARFEIRLSGNPGSPKEARNAPEFKDYFAKIWKEVDYGKTQE